MQVAGIDLAWGTKARTGLALTDADGRLVKSSSVMTDADIVAFLAGSTPVVIAIDAPIVVRNPTGMRECERLLSADFRRFHAGTHPTNMGRPSMQPEPRAMALTRRHGWHVEAKRPLSKKSSVAIEVYPHSAMVGLFGLARILEYKAKSGRTLDSRRHEFHALMDLTERHCNDTLQLSHNERWHEIRRIVDGAIKQSTLSLMEDELDAIFCAYVAWVFAHDQDRLITYGNPTEGAIVTFPPPAA
jgi:predicted RNase H-like nuclease